MQANPIDVANLVGYAADTYTMRMQCKNNIWPKTLLEKYHPRQGYQGDVYPSLIVQSPSLEFVLSRQIEGSSIDSFLDCFNYPLHVYSYEIVQAATSLCHHRKGYQQEVDILQLAQLSKQVNDSICMSIQQAQEQKRKLKKPRPVWLSSPDYEGDYDSPSIFSTALAASINRIRIEFEIDPNLVFDTAYLMAMIPAMYGKCYIDSCLQGLVLAGLLSKDYSKQLI